MQVLQAPLLGGRLAAGARNAAGMPSVVRPLPMAARAQLVTWICDATTRYPSFALAIDRPGASCEPAGQRTERTTGYRLAEIAEKRHSATASSVSRVVNTRYYVPIKVSCRRQCRIGVVASSNGAVAKPNIGFDIRCKSRYVEWSITPKGE